jgi:hypothetical protein
MFDIGAQIMYWLEIYSFIVDSTKNFLQRCNMIFMSFNGMFRFFETFLFLDRINRINVNCSIDMCNPLIPIACESIHRPTTMNMSMYLIHDHLHLCRISSSSMKQTMFQCQIRIYPLENVVLVLLPKMNYIGHNAQIMHRSNKCIYSYPLCAFFFLFFLWIEFLSGAQAFFTVRFRFSFAFDNFKSFHLLE